MVLDEFFSEYDLLNELELALKKARYKRVFKYIYERLKGKKFTIKDIQKALGVVDRASMWQVLQAFVILKMLWEGKVRTNRVYCMVNNGIWDVEYEKLIEEEKKEKDRIAEERIKIKQEYEENLKKQEISQS